MTFEKFLEEKHAQENPMVLDDDMPDDLERWMGNLDVAEVMEYAEEWHNMEIEQAAKDYADGCEKVIAVEDFTDSLNKLNNL